MVRDSYAQLRQLTWRILDTPKEGDRHVEASTIVNVCIFFLIVLNVLATVAGTVNSVREAYGTELRIFEIASVVVFTVEYVLRVWSCIEDEAYDGSIRGRLTFAKTLPAVVDLVAVLPFYLSVGLDLRFVRVLRLLRVFRLVKAARYFPALRLFGQVFREKKEEIIVSISCLAMLLVMTSSLIYYAERQAQPEAFGSIPESLWWSVVTVTTVGYGDAYPITTLGRILGGIVALLGTGIGAIPAGLLASGFSEAMDPDEEAASPMHYCPHCGAELAGSVAHDETADDSRA
jgi:voltage-gated potassium channel